ncbi:Tn3 family transposase, partial [Streptomyces sp. NPDC006283]|uniref:Tn3 family transposase n=1 Tax=Streptomyces sp. NPDC006283 TaxID=3156741 RepID=UPI0033AC1099
MLPKVDFPELLLEVAELTGMADAFTHISGAESHMEGFTTSLCAVLLTEACNVGLTPVIKPDVPALTRGRLVQVDQGYFRPRTSRRRAACSSRPKRRSTSSGPGRRPRRLVKILGSGPAAGAA